MSADEPSRREVAHRLFAAEFDDADYSYSESDEERAPNYVVTPAGARVNRLFVVGVLTEVQQVSDDVLRGRVADPTGVFVLYAGQYQPDERAFLERADPPAFVAVTGKARTFQPDDSEVVYTSVRPESINPVDAETRDRWTVQTVEQTLDRISRMATAQSTGLAGDRLREALAERGFDDAHADGIARALDHYGTTPAYLEDLRRTAVDAAAIVAGERDSVRDPTVAPDEPGDVTAADLVTAAVDLDTQPEEADPVADETRPADTQDTESGPDTDPEPDTGTATAPTEGATATETQSTATASADDSTDEGVAEPEPTGSSVGEAPISDDLGDFDADEFDLPEEVREEVQSEYGTEFTTGAEVDEPGEADIETPDGLDSETADEESGERASPADTGVDGAEADETDPQAAVLSVMADLDDGSGADREAVVTAAGERHGLSPAAVEEAIQSALMDGECYEPDETSLKPI